MPTATTDDLQATITEATATDDGWRSAAAREAVTATIDLLDTGEVRVAEPHPDGDWVVHTWVKQAILLLFRQAEMATTEVGPYEYHDKLALKTGYAAAGVRVVPPGTARHGAHLGRGVVLMPGYVNIGAWVGAGTMVDTWATVGSCAQVGRNVHLSGGVGLGGVLEPAGATPVVIEDDCFIGSRSIIVEGVRIGAGAVVGANTVLTKSTPIIDVTGDEPVEVRGHVPPGAVVIPGTRPKEFPAGTWNLPCALIIGRRTESTNAKTSLNETLREFAVQV